MTTNEKLLIIGFHLLLLFRRCTEAGRLGMGAGGNWGGTIIGNTIFGGAEGGGLDHDDEGGVARSLSEFFLVVLLLLAVFIVIKSCYDCCKYAATNEKDGRRFVRGRDRESQREERVVNIYRALQERRADSVVSGGGTGQWTK